MIQIKIKWSYRRYEADNQTYKIKYNRVCTSEATSK